MRNFNFNTRLLLLTLSGVCLLAPAGFAQEPTLESRLREALRRTTADLHALQDQIEIDQAELAKAKAASAALAQTNDELKAKLEAALAVSPPPAAPSPAPPNETALAELQAALRAANNRIATLQSQAAVADAAVRAKTAEAQAQSAGAAKMLISSQDLVKTCQATNAKLVGVASEIIETYKSESFRAVWLRSYEPLLGLDRVKLQNIMQDFEDRVREHRLPPVTK